MCLKIVVYNLQKSGHPADYCNMLGIKADMDKLNANDAQYTYITAGSPENNHLLLPPADTFPSHM